MNKSAFQRQGAIFITFLLILLTYTQVSMADDAQKLQDIYNSAKKTADQARHSLNDLGLNGKGMDQINEILLPKESLEQDTTTELKDLEEQGTKARDTKHEGNLKACTRDNCNTSSMTGIKAINERASKLDNLGFKKDSEQFPANTKGYIDTARNRIKEYSKFDPISKSYKDCKSVAGHTYKNKTECDEYYDIKHSNCPINQAVEIDAKHTYRCSKKREDAIKTCYSEITSMKCKNRSSCDNGEISLGNTWSDMEWEYGYPTFTLRKKPESKWSGDCRESYLESHTNPIFDRSAEFHIKDLKNIKAFKLIGVKAKDHIWVKVNDKTAYVGPYGGDQLNLKEEGWEFPLFIRVRALSVTTNGGNKIGCRLGQAWERGIDIDLKKFLVKGLNSIWIRVIASGYGEAQLKFKTEQHCCKEWDISRQEKCEYEDLR